ncbi:cupin domain-containing protein [Pelagibacterium lacus]|uniref:Cupin domain-containing protein n=1 Tax=Pelagibacterium lacus TaxID=2282655 RepID=A0A369VZU4_9HYPH|nr:cupin domain-containing protein [Pelagibacterium lacus]RDE07916.1 cupin domain-containing protein [Pelagibacterium lacus]
MADEAGVPERLTFADDGRFPNSRLPALLYRGAVDDPSVAAMKARFTAHGWFGQWAGGIFDYHHYHSTAHEALGVASGAARVTLGGPGGEAVDLAAGDVVVIPAGVAHRRDSASADFCVVGAYPEGQDWDILRGEPGDRDKALVNLARVPLPESDPVTGRMGGLVKLWQ